MSSVVRLMKGTSAGVSTALTVTSTTLLDYDPIIMQHWESPNKAQSLP
jgi:hypothetical protein